MSRDLMSRGLTPLSARAMSWGLTPLSTRAMSLGLTPRVSGLPGRRVVRPAARDHRGHDLDLRQLCRLARERVAVENHQVGVVAGQELAAAALVAAEPRGGDR